MKVLIADDHAVVRKGLIQIISELPGGVDVEEACCGKDVVQKTQKRLFDVVVLDISLPDRSGLDILKDLKSLNPKLPVLILSVHPEEQYAVRALRAGASGYLTKESAPEELLKALRMVVHGRKYISASLAEKLASLLDERADSPRHESLSDREYQILCLLAQGKTVSQIAGDLHLSPKTVSTYRVRVLLKMNMKSNAELTHYAFKHGLVD
jgi:DNA-binding NarL/FixJ family response regulator